VPGSAHIIRADAKRSPLRPGSVHLAISSPGYFGLRWYFGAGAEQIGGEDIPEEYLRSLWAVSDRVWELLWDRGSWFVNLGQKFAGSGGHNNVGISSKSTLRGNGHVGGVGKAGPNKIKTTPRSEGGPTGATSVLAGRSHTAERDRTRATRRTAPDRYVQGTEHYRPKSVMLLPQRFALGMICPQFYRDPFDPPPPGKSHPQWILRAPMKVVTEDPAGDCYLWDKPNSLPSSKTDAVNLTHEDIFHFTKSEHYFAAVDEIREPHKYPDDVRGESWRRNGAGTTNHHARSDPNPLGSLPGSVWRLASEPLKLPTWRVVRGGRTVAWFLPRPAPKSSPGRDMAYADALKWMRAMGLSGGRPSLRPVSQHFAAYPSALPEKIIRGWSPSGVCVECGEPRRPVVEKRMVQHRQAFTRGRPGLVDGAEPDGNSRGMAGGAATGHTEATILGYACACTPYTDHPERRGKSFVSHSADGQLGQSQDGSERNKAYREGRSGPSGPVREYHFAGWTPPPTRPAVVLDPFCGTGTTMLVAKALGRTGVGTELSHPYAKLAEWRCTHEGAKTEARAWQQAQGSFL
jgi:DNA modification methylase